MNTADVVVVGSGIIGSAIAWHLVVHRPDLDVLLLDVAPAVSGATAQSGGLLRRHHTLRSDTRLASASLPTYVRWSDIVGGTCGYEPVGFLMVVGADHHEALRANISAARKACGEVVELDEAQLAAAFPDLTVRPGDRGALEPRGGFGCPTSAAQSWQADFRRRGGRQLTGVEVLALTESSGSTQTLETNIGAVEGAEVVLANGTGAARLLADRPEAPPLSARRIGLARIGVPASVAGRLPACIDDVTGTYFRPMSGPGVAVGARLDQSGHQLNGSVSALSRPEIAAAQARAAKRVPATANGTPYGSQVAADAYTPDSRPVLGRSAATGDRVTLALGFSGGGFKIAPAVGDRIARRVLGLESTADELMPYQPDRFSAGRPLVPEAPYAHM